MARPTLPDLYLAFRQAKTALYFERRGVGLFELAQFEANLPASLAALAPKLANGAWFDQLEIGEVWIVPKRLHDAPRAEDGVVRVGSMAPPRPRRLDVQLRLTPSPELAIAELLYLRAFGPKLESLLSENAIGYRLDLRDGQIDPYRRWTFEYWPRRYQQFRSAPLAKARAAFSKGAKSLLIVSADLASFYDSIDPGFLLSEAFLASLASGEPIDLDAYVKATTSLLGAFSRFRDLASRRLGLPVPIGIPIGSLTSRIIANVVLATMDAHVEKHGSVLAYRRYVDDIVIVAKADAEVTADAAISAFLPISMMNHDIVLDAVALGREGSDLRLQRRKVKVHQLHGEPGKDFVEAVLADFDRLVSRNQAFLDATALLSDGATHLIRAGDGEGSPLRVLRDADRAHLERFALSTSLRTLERASALVSVEEAQALVRRTLERVGRVLNEEDNWVESLDVALRLLRLAVGTDDWSSSKEINDRLEAVIGSVASLKSHVASISYRGQSVDPAQPSPWIWLRNYLHARRVEACASPIRTTVETTSLEQWLPQGLTVRTAVVRAEALRRRARELAGADLRSYDREDDTPASLLPEEDGEWMKDELAEAPELSERMERIRAFVDQCRELGDRAWLMSPARLFLCTRPPSYFDIARRLLYRTEANGFPPDVFIKLLDVVNAIRGTSYQDPIGEVRDRHTVSIPWTDPREPMTSRDPTLVLANLTVPDSYWGAAASRNAGASPEGNPVLTVGRLAALNRVLGRAAFVAQRRDQRGFVAPTLLVVPELTLPRRWLRRVANHIVRHGGFGAVIGLEYRHVPSTPYVLNQAYAVIPGPFASVATWPWTKLRPAHNEGIELARLGLRFPPVMNDLRRTVVETSWGRFSTLICSELIEARRVADLLGRAELVVCPAWNTDTSSYDHLVQSVGFQLHAILGIANNGHYSDCRAWAPRAERWARDLCRLIERDVDDIVYVDLPLRSLIAFHQATAPSGLPEGTRGTEPRRPEWRPLPPDWPPHGT